ncbi:hypothetical protein ACFHW2_31620 [Actinomadura sp. LOL_016]|uniref:hypothetical protein n=1 Tax=unclassified Actinomadura TaxID=2626254 RepID=UPI003A802481
MNWWRRKPSRPTDSDADLADIHRDLVWKFGEDIAYAIGLTGKADAGRHPDLRPAVAR